MNNSIIVSYNSMHWAERCHSSLRASSVPCDVLMIDNGSTDGTIEYVKSHFPEVQIIETGKNLGFGKANNIGLQLAVDQGYEYVYLLNQDAWVLPDTLEKLILISKRHPEYGILSPIQIQANGPRFDTNFLRGSICQGQQYNPSFIEDLYFGRKQDIYQVDFVMAAHWLVTRKCIMTTGGFSPTFPHYGEDDNYADRVLYWKMKVGVVPTAIAIHDRDAKGWNKTKKHYIEDYIFLLRNLSNPNQRLTLKRFLKDRFITIIANKEIPVVTFSFRILREYMSIRRNYSDSLRKGAFLRTV